MKDLVIFMKKGEPHFVLDFDGTLIPIRSKVKELTLPQETEKALEAIRDFPVTILSGRNLSDLQLAFNGYPFNLMALNGLANPELYFRYAEEIRRILHKIIQEKNFSSIQIEDKGALTAVHFRKTGKVELGPQLMDLFSKHLGDLPYFNDWKIYLGKMVVNIEPMGASKAGFVENYLKDHPKSHVLFAGDDTNDLPVFSLTNPRLCALFIKDPTSQEKNQLPQIKNMSQPRFLKLLHQLGTELRKNL